MGQVTVNFMGICTIFRDLPSQVPPGLRLPPEIQLPANRVVLARTTLDFLRANPTVPLHVGKLQLIADRITMYGPPLPPATPPEADSYALNGVSLKILNTASNELTGSLSCLPSLQAHLQPPALLGPPADCVFIPDFNLVQAWFDLPGGIGQGFLLNPRPPCPPETQLSSVALFTLETVDLAGAPPNTVLLSYTPWYGVSPTIIALEGPNPLIAVENFADGTVFVDDNQDFLLNYTLARFPPPRASIIVPTESVCTQQSPVPVRVPGGCGDAGPGCSTTDYP